MELMSMARSEAKEEPGVQTAQAAAGFPCFKAFRRHSDGVTREEKRRQEKPAGIDRNFPFKMDAFRGNEVATVGARCGRGFD
jgi:hypothetical protein